ncbi:putative transcription factor MYB-HB-like family [Helianthus annuus]|nr:putative transcription factor MYB-HB-like family [Helianthus annuus]
MHECTSGFALVVNAERNSMGGVGISSTPSLQQSSDLEKTQAELRQTFTTAEKFRRELEFLQKGGDPLDLKPVNATSVSFQSTSLRGHPEQFVTSEAKGSFAITASPHGDSVESSGRLGAPEPNSADNLMLLKESGDTAVLELPKKSYKRRIRSRPNRDPIRHASRDYKGLTHDANVALKNSVSHLENELDGLPIKSDGAEAPLTTASIEPESVPTNGNTEETKSVPIGQHFDDYNGNGLHTTKPMEQNLGSNDLGAEKHDSALNIDLIGSDDHRTIKEEEGLKGSESIVGPDPVSQDGNANDPPATLTVNHSTDGAEQNTCSQDNLKSAAKEHEDSVLKEARIIEAKRKRIAELSVRTMHVEKRLKSHWDFVLEEMSWLANDFAQERLWKVTAAAQISRRVAFASQGRFRQQISLQKQKELSHTLAEAVMQFWHMTQVKRKGPESHCNENDHAVGILRYAMRFMEYNSSQAQCNETRSPVTLDIISDLGIMDHSWEDNLTEENLFYTVPPGAIEAYRKAIDSHMLHFERTGTSMQEEVDTSCYDAVTDNDAFEEDEGETNTYYSPGGFDGSKSTKAAQKQRTNFNSYGARSYAAGDDVSFMQSVERTVGKRYGSSLNVTIPTKRVRTASRQRIISPYNAGTSGHIHASNRTDASSADTNSFQDEHSILHGGAHIPNSLEAESAGDYEKQLQFDSMEVSNRPKKKKKDKHSGPTFEHRWQHDSSFQNDQKDHSRRRLDARQFDSNGSSAVSQMSNMSNSNKFVKSLVRDRGRKVKALKNPVRQSGSGSPWSLFEDQALVVLVHDMGPNWELISDAINSTLQFKCIFRKSKDCKERHKILMDMNNGDGADSAEDSGSSQPYPSTLPGIPEGSARQLFQRLQGPMEEDTLKSHFEKIIMIGQKQHYRKRSQNDNQDPKQVQQPHSSHAFALSQVFPNNLNGGPVLTPLELAEAISSSPDVLPAGYQGFHSGGLPALNHGPVAPVLPGSTSAPGSSNPVHGSNLPSASAQLNPSVREGRYGVPRAGSLSVDDQQRMQQYGQMLSARNAQQSSLPPGNDRGVRMLPAGNGMGVMSAVNRNMKMTRPTMLSSGSSTPSSSSMHTGPGNPMLRPCDSTHMMRAISPQQAPHHFQGALNHHANPALAMRLAKERQLQQQRLLQQQQLMHHVQPQESQHPVVSSPQSSAAARSTSPPVSVSPSMTPKHPGLVRNAQTSGNQLVKQQRPHPHQQAKLVNGFSGTEKAPQSGPNVNLYPSSSAGKQSVPQQKTLKRPLDSSDNSKNQNHGPAGPAVVSASSNHLLHLNQKLANQKQATAQKLLLLNRKVNTADLTTTKQVESPMSQPSTAVTIPNPPCNDANSSKTETRVVSSAAPAESEPSGPSMNQATVHRQTSSDNLPNLVEHDAGVPQQQQQQPS